MNRTNLLLCVFFFVLITAYILSVDTPVNKRVRFSNQQLEIKNEFQEVSNQSNARISLENTNITNSDINSNNSNFKINNISTNNTNSKINFENNNFINNDNKIAPKNQSIFEEIENRTKNRNANLKNKSNKISDYAKENEKESEYIYKDVNWNNWKSNFVNKILDDSVRLGELDNYSDGTWFYYSFIVNKSGTISNIQVRSPYLSEDDKENFKKFIKKYEYTDITKFPSGTNRRTATVKAVMVLSNEATKHATPDDFHDYEKIKYEVNK